MIAFLSIIVTVVVTDVLVKWWLRLSPVRPRGAAGGTSGLIRVVEGQLWWARTATPSPPQVMWAAWAIGAAVLVIAAVADPALRVATALMLGGAFANLFEHTRRGTVTDYICLGWWPAFNLADAALMAGAVGYGFAVWHILASSASRGL